jgi:hypothetical protein
MQLGKGRQAYWFVEHLLPLNLGILFDVLFGNIIVFGKRMGKDKSETQDTHRDSHPMAEAALALGVSCCRAGILVLIVLSHCSLLSV